MQNTGGPPAAEGEHAREVFVVQSGQRSQYRSVGPAQRGFGFPRRNTATSWRNASNSASLDADERQRRQPGQDDSEEAIDQTDRHDHRSSQVTAGG
jgi:hypothetical protein